MFTAISINVGNRRQAYVTRLKGSMGRNRNSIVGLLAIASEPMKVCLRVLKKGNKSRYDTFCEGLAVVDCFGDFYPYSLSV